MGRPYHELHVYILPRGEVAPTIKFVGSSIYVIDSISIFACEFTWTEVSIHGHVFSDDPSGHLDISRPCTSTWTSAALQNLQSSTLRRSMETIMVRLYSTELSAVYMQADSFKDIPKYKEFLQAQTEFQHYRFLIISDATNLLGLLRSSCAFSSAS